ncbi:hypothetical protein BV898_08049 [Hypsibius exemplaris]|uniref:Uncharacterized protein n=1 Tax=Hypsibius exemplaris TaxID=2072580 RepID=A0A1W0WRU6_HYPEX|nr:hypothetical protein BV898_08049 [Hypsibius exemplaris]
MSNYKIGLLISAVVVLLMSDLSSGFALRIYPGFAPRPSYQSARSQLVQDFQHPLAADSPRITPSQITPATLGQFGFKSMGNRRGGPLNNCSTYLECKSRLLSYLDVMMKMSNKGR